MRRLDELHLEHPVYGSRKLTVLLRREGRWINRKRVVRLLRVMGIEAIYAKTEIEPAGVGTSDLPVSVEGFGRDGSGSSVVRGHNVCAYGQRVYVFGGGHGLVESLCAGVALEQHDGGGLLCGRLGGGVAGWAAIARARSNHGSQPRRIAAAKDRKHECKSRRRRKEGRGAAP